MSEHESYIKLQYKIEIFMCYVALMYKYYFDGVNWFDIMYDAVRNLILITLSNHFCHKCVPQFCYA